MKCNTHTHTLIEGLGRQQRQRHPRPAAEDGADGIGATTTTTTSRTKAGTIAKMGGTHSDLLPSMMLLH